MLVCLVFLTATFLLLTIYSILQANAVLLPIEIKRFLSFKILDTASTATLFVTLLGALLVRHQFALGLLPRINYKSIITTKQNIRNPNEAFETWRVEIRNSGLGAAIITHAEYVLEFPGSKSCLGSCKFNDVISELTKIKLTRGHDYWLENIGAGFALSPSDDCFAFEIKMEHLAKIKRLDVVLYFQSQLSDKYQREILLIPHRSIRPVNTTQDDH